MAASIEGIYAGYMTGAEGNGFSMFVFLDGIVSGVDPLGVQFDGTYRSIESGYEVSVTVTVPSGGTVIQGASAGSSGMRYDVKISLPLDFAEIDHLRIETPLGPVNLRLKKIKDIGAKN